MKRIFVEEVLIPQLSIWKRVLSIREQTELGKEPGLEDILEECIERIKEWLRGS